MTHDDAADLLAAFALDAVEDHEYQAVELHLKECRRCASELVALREVASALGNCVVPVPEDMWSGISARIVTPNQPNEPPPRPRLIFSRSVEPDVMHQRRTSRRGLVAAAGVAASVAVAGVLGISLVQTTNQNDRLQAQIASNASSVVAALEIPGHKVVNLTNASHMKLAQFVVLPSGRGYLVSSTLPKLSAGHTYQLWGTIRGQAISLGLLGQSPSQATFTLADSTTPDLLGVTVEPAGGSVVPTTTMLASGTY